MMSRVLAIVYRMISTFLIKKAGFSNKTALLTPGTYCRKATLQAKATAPTVAPKAKNPIFLQITIGESSLRIKGKIRALYRFFIIGTVRSNFNSSCDRFSHLYSLI